MSSARENRDGIPRWADVLASLERFDPASLPARLAEIFRAHTVAAVPPSGDATYGARRAWLYERLDAWLSAELGA